ncbi:hypothetical protein [Arthrobacter sp. CAL618]|uniref:hypothetical protein n=1 Tax=Arthrobacter sp. CAL618 TaxID=1055770 RepID=UPI0004659F44|nr:hypothetical protein [Arthrobacter sp. CAL618]
MTYKFSDQEEILIEVCRTEFGDEARWFEPEGYRDGLALCVIDSIFSTGSHYRSVINVVNRYWDHRKTQGGDPRSDGVKELENSFVEAGGSEPWADLVGNRKPAHTGNGALLKAEVVRRAAAGLQSLDILSTKDLHGEYQNDPSLNRLKSMWRNLPSQSSGVTFNYLLILAGLQSVKADRMILRFIEQHTKLDSRQINPSEAADLVMRVAEAYPTTARRLDHVIWRHTSGREHLMPEPSTSI